MIRPRRLRTGDRIAVVAPASPFDRDEFERGLGELRTLGFEPAYDDRVFARTAYVAGAAALRAQALVDAWRDPDVAALIAVRGGYGSVQVLPLIDPGAVRDARKPFIGYSDTTSLLTFITCGCGVVSFHGPMLDRRLSRGDAAYDRRSFLACLCEATPAGELEAPSLEAVATGDARGTLVGGTLTQLVASLGTPFAFDPPPGHVLFVDEVNERPYRIDRMLTQLRLASILERASAVVFGDLPGCDEPGGGARARDTIAACLDGFRGPVLIGLPSGHTPQPALTLPFGVTARVVARPHRPVLVIEEPAVED